MTPTIQIRIALTESQAENLQKRLSVLPFKVSYQEEQHGAILVVCITCTASQHKQVREIFSEIGAAITPPLAD